jgi:hypothetical protein
MATKKTTKRGASIEETLKTLDQQLAGYAPKRHAKIKGTGKLDRLAKLVPIPSNLRALWAWADGAKGIIVLESHQWLVDEWKKKGAVPAQYPGALDLFSVEAAEQELRLIREAEEDQEVENAQELKLIPFAAEPGSGDCLVLDAKGRVFYWNHEEPEELNEVEASLAKLLERTVQSVKRRELFGGPES